MKTILENPVSAFGELAQVTNTPVIQIDAVSGLRTKSDVETFTASGGSATVANTGTGMEFGCITGTSAGAYGLIRSKRYLRYRPGQGALMRFTARFPTAGVANSTIRAGGVTSGTELSFGYNGTTFGILHRTGGVLETYTLTLSVAASGNETATITLNDTAFPVSITAGTTAHNAAEIAAATFTGWNAYQNGSTVVFVSTAVGALTGAYSFSSTGDADGTLAETIAGVAVTDNWVAQTSWNIDRCNGTGPSGMTLDPSKGNVYQIEYQYLGYGQILYSIENPGDGRFMPVHRIQYANTNTSPSLLLPSMKIGWFAASLGSTTSLSVYGASGAGFVQGPIKTFRNPDSVHNSKASVTTTLTNIISIRVRPIINGTINTGELKCLLASVAIEGTKPGVVQIVLNATIAGTQNWTYQDEDQSIVEYDTAGTTVTLGANSQVLSTFDLGKSANSTVNLDDLGVILSRTETLTIAVQATSGTVDSTGSITFVED